MIKILNHTLTNCGQSKNSTIKIVFLLNDKEIIFKSDIFTKHKKENRTKDEKFIFEDGTEKDLIEFDAENNYFYQLVEYIDEYVIAKELSLS